MAGRSLGRASRVASTVRVVYAKTPMEIRASILGLHKANTSLREISRRLKLSRNTVHMMGQLLAQEHGIEAPYSTLTRWVRLAELRTPPKRSGEYHHAPAVEMQHDTSPHKVQLAGKLITAQCASLTLAYSRRLFAQYYPRFTRFEAKDFLVRAAQFMDGVASRCVIDNTSATTEEPPKDLVTDSRVDKSLDSQAILTDALCELPIIARTFDRV